MRFLELYGQYLDVWLSGVESEIAFWNTYMKTRGGAYFVNYQWTTSTEKTFSLEHEIPKEMYGKEYKVLDVGSGPFSRLGTNTDKAKLDMLCIDPLGMAYARLKRKYGVDTGIRLETGFVEMLDRAVPADAFHLVHMSNSLDHSFDPIYGIKQLLHACKMGGKVILRHAENEAERAEHKGFHQWNLSLKNEEKSFVIWRDDKRFDVCKLMGEYADIELYPDEVENGSWRHNKVVLTKRKNIQMPPLKRQTYYDEMLEHVYRAHLETLLKSIDSKSNFRQEQEDMFMRAIAVIYQENKDGCINWLKQHGNAVVVYGMGCIGEALYVLLKKCNADVVAVVDRRSITYTERYMRHPRTIHSVHPDEYVWDGTSLILVTVMNSADEAREWALSKVGLNERKVVLFEKFISFFNKDAKFFET